MKEINSSRKILLRGISWSAFERLSVQAMQFVVFIFMARALSPVDYGLVGMLTVFIVVSQLLAEGGMSQAIIRKLDRNMVDCSTAFWSNIAFGLTLYLILFFCAPLISRFYNEPQLTLILRVLAAAVILQSTLVIHRSLLTACLDFKTQAKSTLVGALLSGAVGIYMAYSGYGPWAIVGLQLTNQVVTGTTLWILSDWKPKFIFSMKAFRNLFGFGAKVIGGKLTQNLSTGLCSLFIGKVFSAYSLGSYTNARQIGSISSENLANIVQRAAYPMFCNIRHDADRMRTNMAEYLRLSTFFIAPIMFGLAAIAEPLTTALIGDQWLYTARLLRLLCPTFILCPLISINMMNLEVYGKGAAYLRLQVIALIVSMTMLAASISFGLSAVCCGMFIAAIINYWIAAHYGGRLVGLDFWPQVKTTIPILINSTVMATIMYVVQPLIPDIWLRIIFCTLIGLVVYLVLSIAFQTETCRIALRLLRSPRP